MVIGYSSNKNLIRQGKGIGDWENKTGDERGLRHVIELVTPVGNAGAQFHWRPSEEVIIYHFHLHWLSLRAVLSPSLSRARLKKYTCSL